MTRLYFLAIVLLAAAFHRNASAQPIRLTVDASDAARRIFSSRIEVPVQPGPLTLVYPKWIPGEHAPTGPMTDVTGIRITASGGVLPWRRDLGDMFAITCEVPAGTTSLTVEMNYLSPSDSEGFSASPTSTARLAIIDWHLFLMYPLGKPASEQMVAATLRSPQGWKTGGALVVEQSNGGTTSYQPVSLEMLVDHPVVTGAYYRDIDLTPGKTPEHHVDAIADSDAALRIPDELVGQWSKLVDEMGALFRARRYQRYHFLLTLSDHVSSFGLEHHECSDDRVGESGMTEPDGIKENGSLLTHEYFHSWNGKFRRPVGLATTDYHQPMRDDLLWVYEGLTEYYGEVLAARCGTWTPDDYAEYIAMIAAKLDHREGRTWRPLQDTCDAASLLYAARKEWMNHRREVDFYDEGELIWLEADVLIRQRTDGQKSLDDFCRIFHGSGGSVNGEAPSVRPYEASEVYTTLNQIAPNDWRVFFETRLASKDPHAPMGGIAAAGWKLVYTDKPNWFENRGKSLKLLYSLGVTIADSGQVEDAIPGMPAYKAGIGPGMKIVAVNGRKYSEPVIHEALAAAKTSRDPIELIIENSEFYSVLRVDYHDGERCPHLEREAGAPDLLEAILRPLTK